MAENQTEKTAGKKAQIHIRVTEEEKKSIMKKAKNYPSLSSLILDSVHNFDERQGKNRLNVLIEFSQLMTSLQSNVIKIGTNINQIAHVLNRANKGINNIQVSNSGEILDELAELRTLLSKIMKSLNALSSKHSRV